MAARPRGRAGPEAPSSAGVPGPVAAPRAELRSPDEEVEAEQLQPRPPASTAHVTRARATAPTSCQAWPGGAEGGAEGTPGPTLSQGLPPGGDTGRPRGSWRARALGRGHTACQAQSGRVRHSSEEAGPSGTARSPPSTPGPATLGGHALQGSGPHPGTSPSKKQSAGLSFPGGSAAAPGAAGNSKGRADGAQENTATDMGLTKPWPHPTRHLRTSRPEHSVLSPSAGRGDPPHRHHPDPESPVSGPGEAVRAGPHSAPRTHAGRPERGVPVCRGGNLL